MSIHIDTAIDEISREIRKLKKQHEALHYSPPSNPDAMDDGIKEGVKALRALREALEDFRVEGYSPV